MSENCKSLSSPECRKKKKKLVDTKTFLKDGHIQCVEANQSANYISSTKSTPTKGVKLETKLMKLFFKDTYFD